MASGSMTVRDAGGQLVNIAQEVAADGTRTSRSALEVSGVPVALANPLPVRGDGSTGKSYGVGQAVPTGQTLLAMVPANTTRAFAWVENQSAGDLTIVGDTGADTEIWTRILTGVGGAKQGADWSSAAFRGRLRVYGAAGAQVSVGEF